MNLDTLQSQLRDFEIDGWLFVDHHGRDPIAARILGLSCSAQVTRRWGYWAPARGEPIRIVHRIEPRVLDALPGRTVVYSTWQELHTHLKGALAGSRRVAMQYSPNAALPPVSLVDAGTVDLVRSFGVDVVSSAELIQQFEARWTPDQVEMHLEAGRRVDAVLREAFDEIGRGLKRGDAHEFAVAEFIRRRFQDSGLTSDHGPIVATNVHSGDPHYEPTHETSSPIRRDDFVLIDLWAKLAQPRAVYYDITWVAYCGPTVPDRHTEVFEVVRTARDRAFRFVQNANKRQTPIAGCQVDEIARNYIAAAGYGDYFTHRLGHSIGEDIHGAGANLDNFETRDDRLLIENTCFSIEPGVYLPEFGVRSEIDCYIGADGAQVTGAVQREIVRIA